MNRFQKILKHVDKSGHGVEIGPSFSPIAPKRDGFKVDIIDHTNREGLLEKYKASSIDTSKIEEVDFVWNGESYPDLLGKQQYYDWVIASHVVEHTPDLIGFLNDCSEIIHDNGIISLAVPDKRFCFDYYRPLTGLSQVIDSHHRRAKQHSPGAVAEYTLNVVARSGSIVWQQGSTGSFNFMHSLEETSNRMQSVLQQDTYYDVHAWCFVPHSFRLLIQDLFELGLISLKEVDFYPAEGCEFFITLGKQGSGSGLSRLELLQAIDLEIRDGIESAVSEATAPSKRQRGAYKETVKSFLRPIRNFILQKK